MRYYLKYHLIAGLGSSEFCEWFSAIKDRYWHYLRITGAGYEVLEFERRYQC